MQKPGEHANSIQKSTPGEPGTFLLSGSSAYHYATVKFSNSPVIQIRKSEVILFGVCHQPLLNLL